MDIFLMLFILSATMLITRLIVYYNNIRKCGKTLLKIKNPNKTMINVSIVLVGIIVALTVYQFTKKTVDLNAIFSNLFWLTISIYFFLPQLIKKRITEKGILELYGFLKWEDIKSYKWNKDNKVVNRLDIMLNKKRKRGYSKVFIFVEPNQKKEVNDILRKNV